MFTLKRSESHYIYFIFIHMQSKLRAMTLPYAGKIRYTQVLFLPPTQQFTTKFNPLKVKAVALWFQLIYQVIK